MALALGRVKALSALQMVQNLMPEPRQSVSGFSLRDVVPGLRGVVPVKD